jgi:hypothetical protein
MILLRLPMGEEEVNPTRTTNNSTKKIKATRIQIEIRTETMPKK